MNYTDVKTFFSDLATANGWEFAHNTEHLSEKIGVSLKGKDQFILVMDEPKGRIKYNGNSYDTPSYGFWILQKLEKGKWAEEDIIYDQAKKLAMLIYWVMEKQMNDEAGLFQYFDPGSFSYEKAGPETKSRLFGVYVSFSAEDPTINNNIVIGENGASVGVDGVSMQLI